MSEEKLAQKVYVELSCEGGVKMDDSQVWEWVIGVLGADICVCCQKAASRTRNEAHGSAVLLHIFG